MSLLRTLFSKKILDITRWKKFIKHYLPDVIAAPRMMVIRWSSWRMQHHFDRRYRILDEAGVCKTRKSDTLFIFGSGYSLNDLSKEEYQHIEQHQTMGFNWFVRQKYVRCDYFLIREIIGDRADFMTGRWIEVLQEYTNLMNTPQFANTVYVIQTGWKAFVTNRLLGLGLLKPGSAIYRFLSIGRGQWIPPSTNLRQGLVHGVCTLAECINFAMLIGFKKLVLVGVDLYDQRYFWLPPDKTRHDLEIRGIAPTDEHPGNRWIIDFFQYWKPFLDEQGVSVEVYNPRSLLNSVFPIYQQPLSIPTSVKVHS